MNKIINDVAKGLKDLGQETVEKAGEETMKMVEGVISGKDLFPDLGNVSQQELAQRKIEEERKRQQEMAKLRAEMGQGRNVEGEMGRIRDEEKEKKEAEEKQFLENLERQRRAEEEERMKLEAANQVSVNPAKRKKSRGSALAKGKQGKASTSDQSATSEYMKRSDN